MSSLHATRSSDLGSNFDDRWVINIRRFLDEELEDHTEVPVSIFNVPKLLISSKPDCYIPQQVAVSPYHYWRPELYEMERYKLAAAKGIQKQSQCLSSFQNLVEQLEKLDPRIRACYNKYLDLNAETLAWMMAINASFLLEFLQIYAFDERTISKVCSKMSHLFDCAGIKSVHNSILRDIVMLENQIPLLVLRKVLEIQYSSLEAADDTLLSMLRGLCQELSPFKMMENCPKIDISKYHHVLDFLYHMIVPKFEEPSEPVVQSEEQKEPTEEQESNSEDSSNNVKQLLSEVWNMITTMDGAPATLIKAVMQSRPVSVIVKLPWKTLSNLPGSKMLIKPIEQLLFLKESGKEEENEPTASNSSIQKPPRVEEIAIPSVADLSKAGVRILPTNGNISTISFDVKTVTLYLPVACLDINTEVVLRNLVAYEASNASGPLVFTRYTELMNGIIDTEEDVRLLRKKGIIQNHLKSDKEAADMWNGMSKSIRLTKVPFLDKVIEDVNRYYNGRWNVKLRKFFKHYVYSSWQCLTLLAAVILLLLMTFQAFCSVYSCSKVFRIQASTEKFSFGSSSYVLN